MTDGAWLVGWGLVKKVFVADNLATIVDAVFRNPDASGLEVLIGVYAFAFQIYGDFSGYSDIARGLSKWMGIELNLNFLFPYFVRSPQEFWRHWHISLSTWLRDYLYVPARGQPRLALAHLSQPAADDAAGRAVARRGVAVRHLGGVSGRAAGGVPVGRRAVAGLGWIASLERPLWKVAGWLVMFHLTCYGWLIFRADSAATIGRMTEALLVGWSRPSSAAGDTPCSCCSTRARWWPCTRGRPGTTIWRRAEVAAGGPLRHLRRAGVPDRALRGVRRVAVHLLPVLMTFLMMYANHGDTSRIRPTGVREALASRVAHDGR